MNKSQRIQLSVDTLNQDKYVKVQLQQEVDTLEFLSMNLSTKDVYQDFNADYGVLIGRVLANGGVGIPNAKISIFIPLSATDSADSQITSIYPYTTPRDKNNEGKRYNLLPRVGKQDPKTKIVSPKQPFGSFPIKEEVVTNEVFLNVYKKYYKYTALTNQSGDYMIFGVPVGTQTVHLSVDITDIGKYSMTPAAMVTNLGYSPNLFTDNGSKIKPSNDLNDLPNIETQEITVDIIPFWGDTTNFTIGITRQDFRIRSVLNNTFVIFGTAFTDGDNSMWGKNQDSSRRIYELFRARDDGNVTVGMESKRIGIITEKIYYYPATVTDTQIPTADPIKDMQLLSVTEYSAYKRDGDFAFIVSCNRRKIVTDELGNETIVPDSSVNGVFTEFKGFFTLEITPEAIPMNFTGDIGNNTQVVPYRFRLKFPQHADRDKMFTPTVNGVDSTETKTWRKQYYTFSGGTMYSISKFHGLTSNGDYPDNDQFYANHNGYEGFFRKDTINHAYNADRFYNVGIIINADYDEYKNSQYQFPSNTSTGGYAGFGANWVNLCVYLPQLGDLRAGYSFVKHVRTADLFCKQRENDANLNFYFVNDNLQKIAASEFNTRWFARSDLNWTDIIKVPKTDILAMAAIAKKGFTDTELASPTTIVNYRNGTRIPSGWTAACPIGGGKTNANINLTTYDQKTYFYKGFSKANCIDFVISLGLV
jgi:hypothetical protein